MGCFQQSRLNYFLSILITYRHLRYLPSIKKYELCERHSLCWQNIMFPHHYPPKKTTNLFCQFGANGHRRCMTISFQTFFVWTLLLIVHTWNSSPLRSNLLRLQCTCTVPTTSARPHGNPLVWACQWPSSQPLLSPQLSHNYDSLWA